MTALDLDRAIADAVLKTSGRRKTDSTQDAPTQAVLAALHAHDVWFMSEETDADGVAKAETARRMN